MDPEMILSLNPEQTTSESCLIDKGLCSVTNAMSWAGQIDETTILYYKLLNEFSKCLDLCLRVPQTLAVSEYLCY